MPFRPQEKTDQLGFVDDHKFSSSNLTCTARKARALNGNQLKHISAQLENFKIRHSRKLQKDWVRSPKQSHKAVL